MWNQRLLKTPPQATTVETKEKNKDEETKEVKDVKPIVKPSVVLDKDKGLDVHVPVTGSNMVDFRSLQGLINIHFHFHNK